MREAPTLQTDLSPPSIVAFLGDDFIQEENNSEVDVIVPTFREVDNVTSPFGRSTSLGS